MANALKGEVAFEVSGETYVLLLDFNALCELENDVPGLMDGTLEIRSPSVIRTVVHAGLAAHHPGLTLRDAGNLIHTLGLEVAGELVTRSFAASFPVTTGGEGRARPRKVPAKAGAGIEQ